MNESNNVFIGECWLCNNLHTESDKECVEFFPLCNILDVEKIAFGDTAQFIRAPVIKSSGQAGYLTL